MRKEFHFQRKFIYLLVFIIACSFPFHEPLANAHIREQYNLNLDDYRDNLVERWKLGQISTPDLRETFDRFGWLSEWIDWNVSNTNSEWVTNTDQNSVVEFKKEETLSANVFLDESVNVTSSRDISFNCNTTQFAINNTYCELPFNEVDWNFSESSFEESFSTDEVFPEEYFRDELSNASDMEEYDTTSEIILGTGDNADSWLQGFNIDTWTIRQCVSNQNCDGQFNWLRSDTEDLNGTWSLKTTTLSIDSSKYKYFSLNVFSAQSTQSINNITIKDLQGNTIGFFDTVLAYNTTTIVNFDLSESADWTGTETGLEVIFASTGTDGGAFVDYFRLWDTPVNQIELGGKRDFYNNGDGTETLGLGTESWRLIEWKDGINRFDFGLDKFPNLSLIFEVPAGEIWDVGSVTAHGYSLGSPTANYGITNASVVSGALYPNYSLILGSLGNAGAFTTNNSWNYFSLPSDITLHSGFYAIVWNTTSHQEAGSPECFSIGEDNCYMLNVDDDTINSSRSMYQEVGVSGWRGIGFGGSFLDLPLGLNYTLQNRDIAKTIYSSFEIESENWITGIEITGTNTGSATGQAYLTGMLTGGDDYFIIEESDAANFDDIEGFLTDAHIDLFARTTDANGNSGTFLEMKDDGGETGEWFPSIWRTNLSTSSTGYHNLTVRFMRVSTVTPSITIENITIRDAHDGNQLCFNDYSSSPLTNGTWNIFSCLLEDDWSSDTAIEIEWGLAGNAIENTGGTWIDSMAIDYITLESINRPNLTDIRTEIFDVTSLNVLYPFQLPIFIAQGTYYLVFNDTTSTETDNEGYIFEINDDIITDNETRSGTFNWDESLAIIDFDFLFDVRTYFINSGTFNSSLNETRTLAGSFTLTNPTNEISEIGLWFLNNWTSVTGELWISPINATGYPDETTNLTPKISLNNGSLLNYTSFVLSQSINLANGTYFLIINETSGINGDFLNFFVVNDALGTLEEYFTLEESDALDFSEDTESLSKDGLMNINRRTTDPNGNSGGFLELWNSVSTESLPSIWRTGLSIDASKYTNFTFRWIRSDLGAGALVDSITIRDAHDGNTIGFSDNFGAGWVNGTWYITSFDLSESNNWAGTETAFEIEWTLSGNIINSFGVVWDDAVGIDYILLENVIDESLSDSNDEQDVFALSWSTTWTNETLDIPFFLNISNTIQLANISESFIIQTRTTDNVFGFLNSTQGSLQAGYRNIFTMFDFGSYEDSLNAFNTLSIRNATLSGTFTWNDTFPFTVNDTIEIFMFNLSDNTNYYPSTTGIINDNGITFCDWDETPFLQPYPCNMQWWRDRSNSINSSYSKTFNMSTDFNGSFSLDLTDIAQLWNNTHETGFFSDQDLFGLGFQFQTFNHDPNSTNSPESMRYGLFSGGLNLFLDWDIIVNETAYTYIATPIEPLDAFVADIDIIYETAANETWAQTSNPNELAFRIADAHDGGSMILVFIESDYHMSYFDLVIYDGTGQVFIRYNTVNGEIITANTSIVLEENQQYKLSIDFHKQDGQISVGIQNGTSYPVLTPTPYQELLINDGITFDTSKIPELLRRETPINQTQGYFLIVNASSSQLYTGETTFHLDNMFSSSPRRDTGLHCSSGYPNDNNQQCIAANPSNVLIDSGSLGVVWNGTGGGSLARSTFIYDIHDFRSWSALLTNEQRNTVSGSGEDYHIRVRANPRFYNGTTGADVQLTFQGGGTSHNVAITDNATFGVGWTQDPATENRAETAFGIWWISKGVLALAVNYWDEDDEKLKTHTIYGNYDQQEISDTVEIEIRYTLTSNDATLAGSLGMTNEVFTAGRARPYQRPTIPIPQEIYYPPPAPSLLDAIFAGLAGGAGALLGGGWSLITGGMLWLWERLGDVARGIGQVLADLFAALVAAFEWVLDELLIPFIQLVVLGFIDFILDTLNLRDMVTVVVNFIDYLIAISFYLYVFVIFLCFTYPLLISTTDGDPIGNFLGIWGFDITFGKTIIGIGVYIPLFLLMIAWTIVLGFDDLLFGDLLPF